MQKIINFENNKNLRVLINYNLTFNELVFWGQIKTKNLVWVNAVDSRHDIEEVIGDNPSIDFEETITKIYKETKKKHEIMKSFEKIFSDIKTIDVVDED